MAYSALPAKAAGDTITLANYDAIKDNFAAGVPDIFATTGDLAVGSAPDTAVRLALGADGDTLVAEPLVGAAGMNWWRQPAARVYNDADFDPTPATWTKCVRRWITITAASTTAHSTPSR